MPTQQLTLASLGLLGRGYAEHAVTEELKRIADDLAGRPGVDAARTLTIKLAFRPQNSESGVCQECELDIEVAAVLPKQRLSIPSLQVTGAGRFAFRADSPEDVNQTTFRDLQPGDQQ